jgi:hypothetical protein
MPSDEIYDDDTRKVRDQFCPIQGSVTVFVWLFQEILHNQKNREDCSFPGFDSGAWLMWARQVNVVPNQLVRSGTDYFSFKEIQSEVFNLDDRFLDPAHIIWNTRKTLF